MAQVVWTQRAQMHVLQIQRHIAADSPIAAATMVRRFRAEAARLQHFPEIGRVVPEFADATVREIIASPYRLIYRSVVAGDRVEVVAVVHGSRLLSSISGLD